MFYTYILSSIKQKGAIYIGSTSDLKKRLKEHNSSIVSHTKKYVPWEIESYFAFSGPKEAKTFEKYLKTNSGKAFLRKRLISKKFKEALAEFNNGRGKRN